MIGCGNELPVTKSISQNLNWAVFAPTVLFGVVSAITNTVANFGSSSFR